MNWKERFPTASKTWPLFTHCALFLRRGLCFYKFLTFPTQFTGGFTEINWAAAFPVPLPSWALWQNCSFHFFTVQTLLVPDCLPQDVARQSTYWRHSLMVRKPTQPNPIVCFYVLQNAVVFLTVSLTGPLEKTTFRLFKQAVPRKLQNDTSHPRATRERVIQGWCSRCLYEKEIPSKFFPAKKKPLSTSTRNYSSCLSRSLKAWRNSGLRNTSNFRREMRSWKPTSRWRTKRSTIWRKCWRKN